MFIKYFKIKEIVSISNDVAGGEMMDDPNISRFFMNGNGCDDVSVP